MLIEHIIKRAGGTEIPMPVAGGDDITYHFKPADGNFDSPHVAEVAYQPHIDRFLSIREGFKIPGTADWQPDPEPIPPQYTGLAAIDVDAMSNKWLFDYARDVMGIDGPAKPRLADKLKADFGVEMDYAVHTAADIVREHARHASLEDKASQDSERETDRQREQHAANAASEPADAEPQVERVKRKYTRREAVE